MNLKKSFSLVVFLISLLIAGALYVLTSIKLGTIPLENLELSSLTNLLGEIFLVVISALVITKGMKLGREVKKISVVNIIVASFLKGSSLGAVILLPISLFEGLKAGLLSYVYFGVFMTFVFFIVSYNKYLGKEIKKERKFRKV